MARPSGSARPLSIRQSRTNRRHTEQPGGPSKPPSAAADVQELIDGGDLGVMAPDFDRYDDVVDEARRRLAGDSLPQHAVKADQHIPALVCELSECGPVTLVTADGKLRRVVVEIARKHQIDEKVDASDPGSVL